VPDDLLPKRRLQSATEREVLSERARKDRAVSSSENGIATGVSTGVPIDDGDVTGQHEVGLITESELAEARARRAPEDRLHLLERKHDIVVDRLGKVEVTVAGLAGEMKVLPDLIGTMKDATKAMQERDHVTFTAKVDVEKAAAQAEIEIDKAKEIADAQAQAEIDKAKEIAATKVAVAKERDVIDARKARRKRWTYVIGGGVAALSVVKHLFEYAGQFIHWMFH
jgi:hypothetical protein